MVVPSEYEIAEGKNPDRSTYSTHFLPQLSHLPLEARKENLFTNVLTNTDLRFSFFIVAICFDCDSVNACSNLIKVVFQDNCQY